MMMFLDRGGIGVWNLESFQSNFASKMEVAVSCMQIMEQYGLR